jgi:hypothetical protein
MSHTKSKNVTTAEKNLVVRYTKLCLREIAKKKYELRSRHGEVTLAELQSQCQVSVKFKGQKSYGGSKGITIDIYPLRWNRTSFVEYPAFDKDKIIGGSEACGLSPTPEDGVLRIVAHEVAHFVQRYCGPHTRWLKDKYRKPHGHGFQAIYRRLRAEVVNPRIAKQEQTA